MSDLEKAQGAQGMTLRLGRFSNPARRFTALAVLAGLWVVLGVSPAGAAVVGSGAGVSGVVRDSEGVVQMGALVQVLTANAVTVATAFTDERGRYSFVNLVPGKYQVRASATLLVPATRANLQLQSGARAIVNLTMATLFDAASWLPATRRRSADGTDDWAWTLRSAANRPILRMVDDDPVMVVVAGEAGRAKRIHGRASVAAGSGGFGQDEKQAGVTLHGVLTNDADGTFHAVVGTPEGIGAMPSVQFAAEYERRSAITGGASRTVVGLRSAPQVMTGAGSQGLQVAEIKSGQQAALGESVVLEVGGSADAVRASGAEGGLALEAHPFVRVTAHPANGWRLQYRMATARDTQEFADLVAGNEAVPVASLATGKLRLERGRHQEISASKKAGRTVLEVALYHDAIAASPIAGGFTGSALFPADGLGGLMLDPASGQFRALGGGYLSDGARFTVGANVTPQLWLAAEYATGDALGMQPAASSAATVQAALAGLKARSAEAASLSLKGKVAHTGTNVRATYRWQPASTITAVDSYGALSDQAYLSCALRQHLRLGNHLLTGLDATIDVTNLLAQGYRPFLSADGQTLYFAQAPRMVQAGLSFTF